MLPCVCPIVMIQQQSHRPESVGARAGPERFETLTLHFICLCYTDASRSLFDEDKLPFGVLLLARYMLVGCSYKPMPFRM